MRKTNILYVYLLFFLGILLFIAFLRIAYAKKSQNN